ncbi:UNVERIFIED_CONTAM: hypothetical protein FKN15_067861 [Acipenser sinensis]
MQRFPTSGALLKQVQLAKLFDDDKHFVDMKLKESPETTDCFCSVFMGWDTSKELNAVELNETRAAQDKELNETRAAQDKELNETRAAQDKELNETRAAQDKELNETRAAQDKELNETRAAQDKELNETRAAQDKELNETRAAQDKELNETRAAQDKELNETRAAQDKELNETRAAQDKELNETRAAQDKELNETRAAQDKELNETRAAQDKELNETRAAQDKELNETRAAQDKELNETRAAQDKELNETRAAQDKELNETRAAQDKELNETRAAQDKELNETRAAQDKELNETRAAQDKELNETRAAQDKELNETRAAQDKELNETRAAQDKELNETRAAQDKELNETRAAQDKELNETRAAQDKELNETRAAQDKELNETRAAQDKELNETRAAQDKELNETRAAQDKELNETRAAQDKELNETQKVLSAFHNLTSGAPGGKASVAQLREFLDSFFEAPGQEFEPWTPADWHSGPQFLERISDPSLRSWAAELHALWKSLGRKVRADVKNHPELYSQIYTPNPIIVPGGRFRELYYWDSYWVINGLLLSEMKDTARGMIDNFFHLVRRYGFIPNGGRVYYEQRSQPPFLTLMVESYYQSTLDKEFLRGAVDLLEQEYLFWMRNRSVSIEIQGALHTLNQYSVQAGEPRPESYSDDWELAEGLTEAGKQALWAELQSGAESGWDFSSRWFIDGEGQNRGTLRDTRTRLIVPVDLNALLCRNERTIASFHRTLGSEGGRGGVRV